MSFPEPPLLDDFERAAENPVSQGGQWNTSGTNIHGLVRLRTNGTALEAGVTANLRSSFRVADVGPDVVLFAVVTEWPDERNCALGIAFDVDANPATADGYELLVIGFNGSEIPPYPKPFTWHIRRIDNAIPVNLTTTTDVQCSESDSVGFWRDGDRLSIWHKTLAAPSLWVEVATVNDATYSGLTGKVFCRMHATFPEYGSLGGETLIFTPQIYRRVFG